MRRLSLVLPLAFLLTTSALGAKTLPASPSDYVHNEGVLTAEEEQALSVRLASLEAQTGRQFAVALFRSLEGDSLEEYANKLFRHWKIGDAKKNDGLLFCVFVEDRRWRLETGYGLEGTLTDLQAASLVEQYAVPHFKDGRMGGGILSASEALAAVLGGGPLPSPPPQPSQPSNSGADEWATVIVIVIFVCFMMFLQIGGIAGGGGSWSSGGGFSSGGGGGGFSGGGGSSGGGGASGSW